MWLDELRFLMVITWWNIPSYIQIFVNWRFYLQLRYLWFTGIADDISRKEFDDANEAFKDDAQLLCWILRTKVYGL